MASTLLGRLMVGTFLDSSGFEKGSRKSTKHLKSFDRRVNTVGRSINKTLGTIGAAFAVSSVIADAARTVGQFDQKVADLASVAGKSKSEISALVDNAKEVGSVSAFSASQVLDLQTELAKLGNSEKDIIKMTKSVGDFSIAVGASTSEAATLAGGTLKAFRKSATDTASVVNTLAVATTKSALDFSQLSTALPIVGTAADQSGVSLERTVALLGVLADRNIDASTSSTALRNIFLDLKKQGLTYEQAMTKINNSTDSLNTANELFGKRGAVVATVLAQSSTQADKLEKSITNVDGALKQMTDERLNTLQGRITLAKSSWEGFVLSIDEGDGIISKAVKNSVDAFSGIFTALKGFNEGANFKQVLVLLYGTEKERATVLNQLKATKKITDEIASGHRTESGGLRTQRGGGLAGLKDINTGKGDPLSDEIKNLNSALTETETKTPVVLSLSDKIRNLKNDVVGLSEAYVQGGNSDTNIIDQITAKEAKIISLNGKLQESIALVNEIKRGDQEVSTPESIGSNGLPSSVSSDKPGENVTLGDSFLKKAKQDTDALNESTIALADTYEYLGEAIGSSLAQGAASYAEFAQNALKSIQQVVSALLKQAVASAVSSALKSLPFPVNLAAGAVAGGLASGLFNTAINSISPPKLAEGGVIKKPTYAMLGEYSGASTNPEIAAPESKLRDIFSGELMKNGGGGHLTGQISGRDIFLSQSREQLYRNRTAIA